MATISFKEDLSVKDAKKIHEIAKALKQPVSTVKYRTAKALKELKRLLEGDA